jgi:hypothetical protein
MANRVWTEVFDEYVNWVKTNGSLPRGNCGDMVERRLGNWRLKQRSRFINGKLPPEKIKLFQDIEVFDVLTDKKWEEKFEQIQSFREKNGRFPSKYKKAPEHEKVLARWRYTEKEKLEKGLLEKDKADRFIKAGLAENRLKRHSEQPAAKPQPAVSPAPKPVQDLWYQELKQVIQFKKQYGRIPDEMGREPHESWLARWCRDNQKMIQSNELPKQKKSLLQAAGII